MNRGEVCLIHLDPTIGAEIKKVRPAVIVNDDTVGILPLRVIVPITDWKDHFAVAPWLVRLEPDVDNGFVVGGFFSSALGCHRKICASAGGYVW